MPDSLSRNNRATPLGSVQGSPSRPPQGSSQAVEHIPWNTTIDGVADANPVADLGLGREQQTDRYRLQYEGYPGSNTGVGIGAGVDGGDVEAASMSHSMSHYESHTRDVGFERQQNEGDNQQHPGAHARIDVDLRQRGLPHSTARQTAYGQPGRTVTSASDTEMDRRIGTVPPAFKPADWGPPSPQTFNLGGGGGVGGGGGLGGGGGAGLVRRRRVIREVKETVSYRRISREEYMSGAVPPRQFEVKGNSKGKVEMTTTFQHGIYRDGRFVAGQFRVLDNGMGNRSAVQSFPGR